MGEDGTLELSVTHKVRIDASAAPPVLINALRRDLRQKKLSRLLWRERGPLDPSAQSPRGRADGDYCLPQGLLHQVTEVCRRLHLQHEVSDQRVRAPCAALRRLGAERERYAPALRQLLLRDCGALVAELQTDRLRLAVELLCRRQQRCLVVSRDRQGCSYWLEQLPQLIQLDERDLAGLSDDPNQHRIAVASYEHASDLQPDDYGLVIFDELDRVASELAEKVILATNSRYMLGLSHRAASPAGVPLPAVALLGGIAARLRPPAQTPYPRLSFRPRSTSFSYPNAKPKQYQAIVARLSVDESRNRLIADDLLEALNREAACVVLSDRRDQLEALSALLPEDVRQLQITSRVPLSRRPQLVRAFESGEADVLLCTSQIALELLTGSRVSHLFVAFPFSYGKKLEQLVAGLLRAHPKKNEAVLYDYDDARVAALHRAFEKRALLARRLQREAEHAYFDWAQLTLQV